MKAEVIGVEVLVCKQLIQLCIFICTYYKGANCPAVDISLIHLPELFQLSDVS